MCRLEGVECVKITVTDFEQFGRKLSFLFERIRSKKWEKLLVTGSLIEASIRATYYPPE